MQFRFIVVTDPRTHSQTGPITIHCVAASAQCNDRTSWAEAQWSFFCTQYSHCTTHTNACIISLLRAYITYEYINNRVWTLSSFTDACHHSIKILLVSTITRNFFQQFLQCIFSIDANFKAKIGFLLNCTFVIIPMCHSDHQLQSEASQRCGGK